MFMTPLPETPPEQGERDDPRQNAYVFLRQLVDQLLAGDYLRPDLRDPDLIAQTIWAVVHGAAALELTLDKQEPWLDFRPRRERFAEALRTLVRAMFRDPVDAEQRLEHALVAVPDFGAIKTGGKARASKTKKGRS
jgi:hypothetical protein